MLNSQIKPRCDQNDESQASLAEKCVVFIINTINIQLIFRLSIISDMNDCPAGIFFTLEQNVKAHLGSIHGTQGENHSDVQGYTSHWPHVPDIKGIVKVLYGYLPTLNNCPTCLLHQKTLFISCKVKFRAWKTKNKR